MAPLARTKQQPGTATLTSASSPTSYSDVYRTVPRSVGRDRPAARSWMPAARRHALARAARCGSGSGSPTRGSPARAWRPGASTACRFPGARSRCSTGAERLRDDGASAVRGVLRRLRARGSRRAGPRRRGSVPHRGSARHADRTGTEVWAFVFGESIAWRLGIATPRVAGAPASRRSAARYWLEGREARLQEGRRKDATEGGDAVGAHGDGIGARGRRD